MATKPVVPATTATPAVAAKPARKGMTKEQRAAYVAKSYVNFSPTTQATIKVLSATNPKRGDSAARFALYTNGMTVAQAIAAGVWMADIRWDVAHKFIEVA
jgi:hypothetical protein